jgi:hypothetical protein
MHSTKLISFLLSVLLLGYMKTELEVKITKRKLKKIIVNEFYGE